MAESVIATLNNVTTSDDYKAPATLDAPSATVWNVYVFNAAVYLREGQGVGAFGSGGAAGGPETFLAPGYYSFSRTRISQMAVRSALAGVSAQVTIQAVI